MLVALRHPVGRRVLGLARPDEADRRRTTSSVFDVLSFAFPVPGEHAAANLGVPDLLFFALFLGAATRFGLRVVPTWLALVAASRRDDRAHRLARPERPAGAAGIALGFLLPNADLLWRAATRPARAR